MGIKTHIFILIWTHIKYLNKEIVLLLELSKLIFNLIKKDKIKNETEPTKQLKERFYNQ